MDKRGDFGPVLFLIVVTSLFLLVLALVLVPLLRNSGIFNNFFGSKLKFTDYYCDVAAKKLSEEKKVEYTFALVKDSAECRAVAVKANQKDFDSFTTRDTASTGYLCCIYTGSSVTRTASAAGTGTGSGTSAAGAGTGVGTATPESPAEKKTCNNNKKDSDEIDIDCGGSCPACKCVCSQQSSNFQSSNFIFYYYYESMVASFVYNSGWLCFSSPVDSSKASTRGGCSNSRSLTNLETEMRGLSKERGIARLKVFCGQEPTGVCS